MKKIVLFLIVLSFNIFAWETFDTEAGGIGIYQNGVTGGKDAQLSIFKADNKYKIIFLTEKYQLYFSDSGFGSRSDMDIINDLGKGDSIIILGFPLANNATQFGASESFIKYLVGSKWIKLSVPVGDGIVKTFKFEISGLEKALKKVEE